jgi:hypothetical protein
MYGIICVNSYYTPPHFGQGRLQAEVVDSWYGMVPLLPPAPWAAIVAARWWQLDRGPGAG